MNNDSIILIFIFITHLFLHCWAILVFLNTSYVVYNIFFFISLLWSIHETKSSAPTLVALLINIMSIIMDAALIGIFWYNGKGFRFVISVMAAFINLLYRLITSLIIFQMWRKRMETETNVGDIGSVTRDLTKYLNFGRTANTAPQSNGAPPPSNPS